MSKKPVRVAVTGAAGQIGYALLFRIASGEMLGKDQPVILQLLEVPIEKPAEGAQGRDDGTRRLRLPAAGRHGSARRPDDRVQGHRLRAAGRLAPARPRAWNAPSCWPSTAQIFTAQGKALDAVASRNVKVLVVGNPANTNAYIAMKSAPSLPRKNFTAMLRLDHNRAAEPDRRQDRQGRWPTSRSWPCGATTRPRCTPTTVSPPSAARAVKDMINDQVWNAETFLPTVGKRGAAIIAARGVSSAASAANAAIDHMRDWALGTNGKWVTMGIPSDGQYGIPKDVMFGFPVTCEGGEYKLVEGLPIDAFSQERINVTLAELQGEQDGVKHLL